MSDEPIESMDIALDEAMKQPKVSEMIAEIARLQRELADAKAEIATLQDVLAQERGYRHEDEAKICEAGALRQRAESAEAKLSEHKLKEAEKRAEESQWAIESAEKWSVYLNRLLSLPDNALGGNVVDAIKQLQRAADALRLIDIAGGVDVSINSRGTGISEAWYFYKAGVRHGTLVECLTAHFESRGITLAPAPSTAEREPTRFAWLIEIPGPKYFRGPGYKHDCWTTDPWNAWEYETKELAENVRATHADEAAKVVEHGFSSAAQPQPVKDGSLESLRELLREATHYIGIDASSAALKQRILAALVMSAVPESVQLPATEPEKTG